MVPRSGLLSLSFSLIIHAAVVGVGWYSTRDHLPPRVHLPWGQQGHDSAGGFFMIDGDVEVISSGASVAFAPLVGSGPPPPGDSRDDSPFSTPANDPPEGNIFPENLRSPSKSPPPPPLPLEYTEPLLLPSPWPHQQSLPAPRLPSTRPILSQQPPPREMDRIATAGSPPAADPLDAPSHQGERGGTDGEGSARSAARNPAPGDWREGDDAAPPSGVARGSGGHGPGGTAGRAGSTNGTELNSIPQPIYPRESRRRGEQGLVILDVEVRADGTIARVSVVSDAGYPRLAKAAIAAVRQARIEPATDNGAPIAAVLRVPFNFVLK